MKSILEEFKTYSFKKPWTKKFYLKEFNKELVIINDWELPSSHKKRKVHTLSVSIGECSIGGIINGKNSVPWGIYGFKHIKEVLPKNFNKNQYFLGFGFGCKSNDGGKLSFLVMYLFFYLLKLISDDILIADSDDARINNSIIAEYALKNIKTKDLKKLMNTNIFYYERFGFIYPRKYEYLSTYLKTGSTDILFADGSVPHFYLKLNTVSFQTLKKKILELN